MLRVAINGFGRIGRTAFKAGWDRKGIQFVGINDLTEPAILAHLLAHDSVFHDWPMDVKVAGKNLLIGGKKIPVSSEKDPAHLPWRALKVDVVLECTGRFTDRQEASKHLLAGAKAVVISAPAHDVPTFLVGVNHHKMNKMHTIVSNASCTTNSVGPVAEIMEEVFGVKKAMLTTIHSVTAEQNLVDGLPPSLKPDLRRARSGLVNIIPTSTGAARAATEVVSKLKNKFDGLAIRVPTIDVSLSDMTFLLRRRTTVEKVNNAFKAAARSARWKGILSVTEEPLVSTDFIRNPHSAIVDLEMTRVVDGDLVKVLAWYDNEWGYAMRLLDLAEKLCK